MNKLAFEKGNYFNYTSISNIFLDKYMPEANGEFVKIYLYLLRCASDPESDLSICKIADIFNYTEKDILRALRYWEQAGLLSLTYDSAKHLAGIRLEECTHKTGKEEAASLGVISPLLKAEPVKVETEAVPQKEKPSYSSRELERFLAKEEISQLLYIVQKYLGKTLSTSETNTLLYFYDVLKFPVDLIEYLIEYCVTKDHRSMRYIEKVALNWSQNNIDTVEKAKETNIIYNANIYSVLKAFGIKGRHPGEAEKNYIVKWTDSYGFDLDIIIDACNRTIQSIHQPSFEYADSILLKWKEKGVKHLSQTKLLDAEHQKNKEKTLEKSQTVTLQSGKNNFNSFSQRTYNYTELEKQLLSSK